MFLKKLGSFVIIKSRRTILKILLLYNNIRFWTGVIKAENSGKVVSGESFEKWFSVYVFDLKRI